MNDELKQQQSADAELRKLIEDAAKLLHANKVGFNILHFNPLDPERGDLMKVADAAELILDLESQTVELPVLGEIPYQMFHFAKGDYQSLALAVLRAASAVWKARGE